MHCQFGKRTMRAFLRYTVNHIAPWAYALSRTAACLDTLYSVFVKSVNELIRFKRFSHYTLKDIDFFVRPHRLSFWICQSFASRLPSCPGVSVSVLPAVFAGHCVNLCSLAANKVQLGSIGAAGVPLQQPD